MSPLSIARVRVLTVLCALGAGLTSLSGCAQGVGDACQLNSDCETGLLCCKDSVSISEHGSCQTDVACASARIPDGGPATDAGTSTDAGVSEDAGATTDAGVSEDAGASTDAGTSTDAGVSEDAGASTDAGVSEDAGTSTDAGVSEDAASSADDAGTDAG